MSRNTFRRFAKRLFCILAQMVMVGYAAGMASYTFCHTDHGKLLALEVARGGACGLILGLFLALSKMGNTAA